VTARGWGITLAMTATDTRTALAARYDELLRSPVLDHDPADRADLLSTRTRHLLILTLIERHLTGPRETIVDVGPGNGALLSLARELGFTKLVGVDHAHWEPQRSFLTGRDDVELLTANFNEPRFLGAFANGSVDAVVSTEVLEHVFNHPWGYLCECWRILRPGGRLAITTPNPSTLANAFRLAAGRPILWNDEWFAKTPKVEEGELVAYPFVHYREYPPSVFRQLLTDLPGASIVEGGFVAHAGETSSSRLKSHALTAVGRLRLGRWRPVSHTQYAIVGKGPEGP
jgi:SAM-dependent methyltransferase